MLVVQFQMRSGEGVKSVEKYTQGYLMKSATMLKVMCRCVYILLLIYNTIA